MNNDKELKIAIIHDHLGFKGGGERTVLLAAMELGADFITAYAHPDTFPDYQKELGDRLILLSKKAVNTRVVRFFWIRWLFWKYRKEFKKYDIVLSSSNIATEMAAGYLRKDALKITYTHSTPRRIYDQYEYSKNTYPLLLRPLFALFVRLWRWFYLRAILVYDINIANSNCVRKRVRNHIGGDVQAVLYPPIMVDKFKWLGQEDYFFSWARLDELKRVELIVKAFQKMPDKKLIVASGGPRLGIVKKLAENYSNIKVLGWISDEELLKQVGNCRAAIYIPVNEDAGMSHLEANAAGKPVLAVREGGLLESVIDGETGIFIKENPDERDIIAGINKMTPKWCLSKKEICEEHAQKYSKEIFMQKLKGIIKRNDPRLPLLGIDASRWEDPRCPGKNKRTGVEVVAKNLLDKLVPLAQKAGLRVRLYTPRLIPDFPMEIQKILPGAKRWTRKILAGELKHSTPNYFFTPSFYIPRTAPKNSFAIIHDIIFKTNPEKYPFREKLMQKYAARANFKRSKKIIAVSEFSKNEIIREYKISPERIITAPLGHNRWPDIDRGKKREKIIFYVGRIEKKKGVDILIMAFAEFSLKLPGWKLILAGGLNFGAEEIKELIKKLKLENSVELAGHISDEKKKNFLTSAQILAHPSSLEGSTLTLFEAWDAHIPAVVSDAPILKETAKNGALFFKAGGAGDLAVKLIDLANDENLKNTLIAEGEKNLGEIPWRKTAKIILSAIIS